MEQKYGHIKLPIEFYEQIDLYMEQHRLEGFTTRVEVVKAALREFFKNGSKNYQPPESGEERTNQGGNEHEQMAERTSTQSNSFRLDNATGKPHRANEKRMEDQTEEIKSTGGEDVPCL